MKVQYDSSHRRTIKATANAEYAQEAEGSDSQILDTLDL